MTSVDSRNTLSKTGRPQTVPRSDRSPTRGTGTRDRSNGESRAGNSSWDAMPVSRNWPWDTKADVDNLPSGKRRVLDKFFSPAHCPRNEETKAKEHENYPRRSRHHQHRQDNEGHGYTTPGSTNGSGSQGQVHHEPHWHHAPGELDHSLDNTHNHSPQRHGRWSDVSPHSPSHDLDAVACCSGCRSHTSSSSSWSSETKESEAFLMGGRRGPSFSQSCCNIPVEGRGFWDENKSTDVKVLERRNPKAQQGVNDRTRKLCRSYSKSDEGLPHASISENTESNHLDHNSLYKSASLGRSLAFSDDTEILLDSEKPKKAPLSAQLPSKGILKNKQGQGGAVEGVSHVRKAKSLEVLSTRVDVTSGGMKEGRGGGSHSKLDDGDVEKKKAAIGQNFVREKLRFSSFLNEITRQVISPSRLCSLGVASAPGLPGLGQASPKSSRKEPSSEGEKQEEGKVAIQQKDQSSTPDSVVSGGLSHASKHSFPSKCHHHHQHSLHGKSQPQHHISEGQTNVSIGPKHCPPPQGSGRGHREEKTHQGGRDLLLTDGANTSPELSPHETRGQVSHSHSHPDARPLHQKNHQPRPDKHQHHHAHRSPSPHSTCSANTIQTGNNHTHSGSLEQESDSSQNKDSASTTSTSVEHSDTNVQMSYRATAALKDIVDQTQSQQEKNEELRHGLLRTLVRMECMEAEILKTQAELNTVKDWFHRLQENAPCPDPSCKVLEQELQSKVLSMEEEQKGLTQKVSELSKGLAAAQTAILSLRNINIPHLQLTPPQNPESSMLSSPAEGDLGVIAHQQCSAADFLSVCPKDSNPSSHLQQQSHQNLPPAAIKPASVSQTIPSPAGGDKTGSEEAEIICKGRLRNRKGMAATGMNSLEDDATVVTYQSAQRMLDNFIHHLQSPEERKGDGSVAGLGGGTKEESLNREKMQP